MLTRNDLVRTAAPNSAEAMIPILSMVGLGRFGGGDPDEDVVQRRPRHLEMVDGGAGGQGVQQVLGVAAPADLLEVAGVVDGLDPVEPAQGLGAGLGPDP